MEECVNEGKTEEGPRCEAPIDVVEKTTLVRVRVESVKQGRLFRRRQG